MENVDKKICIRCKSQITDNRNYVCEKCWNEAGEFTKMQLQLLVTAMHDTLIDEDYELKS